MKKKYQLKITLLWLAISAFIVFLCVFWNLIQVVQSNNNDMMNEVAAITAAHDAVQAKLTEDNLDYDIFEEETEITIDSLEDDLIYEVTVNTGYQDTNERIETFRVHVSTYDGTVTLVEDSN